MRGWILVLALCAPLLAQQTPQQKLAECREQIDKLDVRITALLEERAAVVKRVGEIKKAANLPVSAPAREQQVLKNVEHAAEGGPMPGERIRRIYERILEQMSAWEQGLVDGAH